MKKITLKRPRESFNKSRSYDIMVGDRKFTSLKNGEKKTLEIPEELTTKAISAKIHWCRSGPLQIESLESERMVIVSGNVMLNKHLPLWGAIVPLTALAVLSGAGPAMKYIGIALIAILSLGLLGTLTLWKDRWIRLSIQKYSPENVDK